MKFHEITLKNGVTEIEVIPERGALVSRMSVAGEEVLFLNEATVADVTRSVRGGIPLLFPWAGKLLRDCSLDDRSRFDSNYPQHGFARDRGWDVTDQDQSSVEMALPVDSAAYDLFAHHFSCTQRVAALDHGVEIKLRVENTGRSTFHVNPGWHPYFKCSADEKDQIRTDHSESPESGFFNEKEFDFGKESDGDAIQFTLPASRTLHLSFSESMKHLQFWSLPGEEFVCIEPFLCSPSKATRDVTARIKSGESETFSIRVELVP